VQEGIRAVRDDVDGVRVLAQPLGQQLRREWFVLNEEQSH